MTELTSLRNPRVKHVGKLADRRYREMQRQTTVEGSREAVRALNRGILPVEAFLCPPLIQDADGQAAQLLLQQLAQERRTTLWTVTPEIFARMAYRGESGGILLVIPYLPTHLDRLPVSNPAFLAVVEGGDKPGNLGAILRSGDAAGVDGLVVCHGPTGGTDLHNPNVVRASLGAIFHLPIAEASTPEAISWLQMQGIQIIAATPEGAVPYTKADYTGPIALITGSEAHGLSPAWLTAAQTRVYIPMRGISDSLNLATSTALLLYEVVRQREAG